MKKLALLTLGISVLCALSACNSSINTESSAAETTPLRTISVNGRGTATSSPDLVSFSFSVECEGEDKQQVQNQNTEETNSILDLLKNSGVSDKDIQTSNYNLSEKWDYEKNAYDGYRASQTITISKQDADTAGRLITLVGQQEGVSNIDGPSYNDSNYEDVYQEALSSAIQNARSKAERMADENGLEIIQINSISENSSYNPSPRYYAMNTMMAKATAEDVSIETGESEITAEVSVVFEIKAKE